MPLVTVLCTFFLGGVSFKMFHQGNNSKPFGLLQNVTLGKLFGRNEIDHLE